MGKKLYEEDAGGIVIKSERKNGWFSVPNYVYDLWLPVIGSDTIGVYTTYCRVEMHGGVRKISLRSLAAACRIGGGKLNKINAKLERCGFIKVNKPKGYHRLMHWTTEIVMLDPPQAVTKELIEEFCVKGEYEPLTKWLFEEDNAPKTPNSAPHNTPQSLNTTPNNAPKIEDLDIENIEEIEFSAPKQAEQNPTQESPITVSQEPITVITQEYPNDNPMITQEYPNVFPIEEEEKLVSESQNELTIRTAQEVKDVCDEFFLSPDEFAEGLYGIGKVMLENTAITDNQLPEQLRAARMDLHRRMQLSGAIPSGVLHEDIAAFLDVLRSQDLSRLANIPDGDLTYLDVLMRGCGHKKVAPVPPGYSHPVVRMDDVSREAKKELRRNARPYPSPVGPEPICVPAPAVLPGDGAWDDAQEPAPSKCPDRTVKTLPGGMKVVTTNTHAQPTSARPNGRDAPVAVFKPATDKKALTKEEKTELMNHFCDTTGIVPPLLEADTKAKRDKLGRAAGKRWFNPLTEIARICGWDIPLTKQKIDLAWGKFVGDGNQDWITAPQSLVETVRGISKGKGKSVPIPGMNGSGVVPLTEAHRNVSLFRNGRK